jgi:hypothetical protein
LPPFSSSSHFLILCLPLVVLVIHSLSEFMLKAPQLSLSQAARCLVLSFGPLGACHASLHKALCIWNIPYVQNHMIEAIMRKLRCQGMECTHEKSVSQKCRLCSLSACKASSSGMLQCPSAVWCFQTWHASKSLQCMPSEHYDHRDQGTVYVTTPGGLNDPHAWVAEIVVRECRAVQSGGSADAQGAQCGQRALCQLGEAAGWNLGSV